MVEDEEDTAALIKMIMEEQGYEIVHAADGQQAQRQIDALPPPALVLLDMGLPHVNGLALLAQIKRKATWSNVPVIMLTADAEKTDICKAIVAGAAEYILKPFKKEDLVGRLRRFRSPESKRLAS
jgi:two-component system phosphate regulon response regulator PhoB